MDFRIRAADITSSPINRTLTLRSMSNRLEALRCAQVEISPNLRVFVAASFKATCRDQERSGTPDEFKQRVLEARAWEVV